jgi:putative heme iron utilization protein
MFINISIDTYRCPNMPMKKIMLALPDEMVKVIEKERKDRLLPSVPETIRVILSDYLRSKASG